MRSSQQVMAQVLDFAVKHDDIRVVALNGSRANPHARQDLFCDYDVAYFVEDPRRYLTDQSWMASFGERVIVQQNDIAEHGAQGHIFLMLFTDGVRIDLFFNQLANLAYLGEDSLTVLVLDKDGRVAPLPPPSDRGYLTARPSAREFAETVNEILWCSASVAKGIWRDELPYVKHVFDAIVRPCILELLAWSAADLHGWSVNTGKFGRWLKQYLPPEVWQAYVRTHAGAGYAETWAALFEALSLTRQCGTALAASLGYAYPLEDDVRIVDHLEQVRALPRDAVAYGALVPAGEQSRGGRTEAGHAL